MTVAFDGGVVKSDTAIPVELQQALKEAVRYLENVPEEQKDYHHGSDNKVADLVHPSLFPVIYGRTRILPDRVIGLDDCLNSIGEGTLLSVPPEKEADIPRPDWGWNYNPRFNPYSRKFQWMPCDVEFTNDNNGCRIVSYINNLHPKENRTLYDVIEKIIARTIPLWDATLTNMENNRYSRIEYTCVDFLDHPEPESKAANEEEEESNEFWDRYSDWEKSRPIRLPEPAEFEPPNVDPVLKVDLRDDFAEEGLQVIVKLANIELTPEKPEYDGGSWHERGN